MKDILKKFALLLPPLFSSCLLQSQNIDFENIKLSKKIKVSGNLSANSVFYNSNTRNARTPFTYYLQGNLNINWLTFSLPISYSYSNQGDNFNYRNPFKFNRLSLHPKYKWIQAHIGDATMNFSPYTLNGHQFTGTGIELTPNHPLKFSMMYGRLLKAVEDDGKPKTIPSFKRVGYGTKIAWEKPNYKVGFIWFYAKDNIKSIKNIFEKEKITPKENLVISINSEATIANTYNFKVEYASTAITNDLRANKNNFSKNIAGKLFNNRTSTGYYNALKASFSTGILNTKLGLNYERIDPNYQTLGAYYFNNDFENITLDFSKSLFNNKVNIALNVGYQRDNLNNQKTQATGRNIGSINITYQVNQDISLSGMYSNLTTFTNKNLNQFDDINNNDITNNETQNLKYRQLSQNSNINLNWLLSKNKKLNQNINLNYSLASSANETNGIIRVGQANNFHNASANYSLAFPEKSITTNTSLNYNYSDIGIDDSNAWGTSISISKLLFNKKLSSSFSTTYNKSTNKNIISNILNLRLSASTTIAKHHKINLNAIHLIKDNSNTKGLSEFTTTLGYVYKFDINKPKFNFKKNKKEKKFQFSYRKRTFKGTHKDITQQITQVINEPIFKYLYSINYIKNNLNLLKQNLLSKQSNKKYKKAALNYLNFLYKYKNFLDKYNNIIFEGIEELRAEGNNATDKVTDQYFNFKRTFEERKINNEYISDQEIKKLKAHKIKYMAHFYMLNQIKKIAYKDVINDYYFLKEIKHNYISEVFSMMEQGKSDTDIKYFLVTKIADYYHKKFLKDH